MGDLLRIGVENKVEGRSLVWALDHPGCFAYGENSAQAVVNILPAFIKYIEWAHRHSPQNWLSEVGNFDIRFTDSWDVYDINQAFEVVAAGPKTYAVNAWFRDDWRPLTEEDVRRAALLLEWGRADLLAAVQGASEAELDLQRPEERWSVRGILKHVAGSEWWYLTRLGQTALRREDLPANAFERLERVRAELLQKLPTWVGSSTVLGVDGEFWSPRKLVRRAIWHELDHVGHICRLLIA